MAESKTPIATVPKVAHTPLPWKIAGWEIDAANGRRIANFDNSLLRRQDSVKGDEARANAELIIRAVNSHQDLLDALRELVKCCPFIKIYATLAQIEKAQAAIEKAEQ